jgi:hypothetical protein
MANIELLNIDIQENEARPRYKKGLVSGQLGLQPPEYVPHALVDTHVRGFFSSYGYVQDSHPLTEMD